MSLSRITTIFTATCLGITDGFLAQKDKHDVMTDVVTDVADGLNISNLWAPPGSAPTPSISLHRGLSSSGNEPAEGRIQIKWWMGRAGNNVKQIVDAVILAEATGRHEVCMPGPNDPCPVCELFNLPRCLKIEKNPSVAKRVTCHDSLMGTNYVEDTFFFPVCEKNVVSDDYRSLLMRYLKPTLNQEAKTACAAEGDGFKGLTIHLRSGDLMQGQGNDKLQAQFAPCAYHEKIIADQKYKEVRIITEPDLAHPCIDALKRRVDKKVEVLVQSGTIAEDACALMRAHNVAHGSVSTFAMHFGWLMNEKLQHTHWCFKQPIWDYKERECTPGAKTAETCRRTFCYDVPGIELQRDLRDKVTYLLDAPVSDISLARQECSQRTC